MKQCGSKASHFEHQWGTSLEHFCPGLTENDVQRQTPYEPPKPATGGSGSPEAETVLEEAQRLIYGARRDDYGECKPSFDRIAVLWGEVLGKTITADQVALCMIQLKVARACNDTDSERPIKRDSIVDIAGYAGCLGKMLEEA